jgi:hypothetical protein
MRAMPAKPLASRNSPLVAWIAQIVQTLVLAGVVLAFMNQIGGAAGNHARDWDRYALYGVIVAAIPALLYVRWFKRVLNQDDALMRANGNQPQEAARRTLMRALALGGALCDLPMAAGVGILMFGGDKRYFIGGTVITLAMRLSYRPFVRSRAH